jgi:hypothetical protein
MALAESYGWDVRFHERLTMAWYGGESPGDLSIEGNARAMEFAMSRFGHGIATFALPFVFRTPPGWDLWVRGPVNRPRDGVAPLEGFVETDWSIAPISVNWQFTRARHIIVHEPGDVIARLIPFPRSDLEAFDPIVMPIGGDKGLARRFAAWNEQRRKHSTLGQAGGGEYSRGAFDAEDTRATQHRTRVRLRRFRRIE